MRFVRGAGRVYLIVIGLLVAVSVVLAPGVVLPLLGLFVLTTVIHIVLHELGHAVAAAAVGYRVIRIVSGTGPVLASVQLRSTLLELRLLPAGGHVLAASRRDGPVTHVRLREIVTVAGGPLATLGVTLGALWLPPDLLSVGATGAERSLPELLTRIGVWLLLGNLIPWNPQLDGARLLVLIRGDAAAIAEAGEVRGIAESLHHYERGDVDAAIAGTADHRGNSAAAGMHAAALSRVGRFAEARAVLVPLLEQDLPEDRRLITINNLAWCDVHLGRPDLLAEADWCSAEAERLVRGKPKPMVTAIASTRAHVLAALGRHDEAASRFDDALAGKLDKHGRAEVLAGRARMRLARGDVLGARQDVDKAVRLGPEIVLVVNAAHLVDTGSLTIVAENLEAGPSSLALPPALADRTARSTLQGARRALMRLAAPEPLLTAAAAGHGVTPAELMTRLGELLGVQPGAEAGEAANRSSIHATS